MGAFKNKKNGTWYVQFRYTDWKGNVSKNSSEDLRLREKRRNGNVNF